PVSALIRLDLPTLERPANAISTPFIGGSRSAVPAGAGKCPSPATSFRPASISAAEKRIISLQRRGRQPEHLARGFGGVEPEEVRVGETRFQRGAAAPDLAEQAAVGAQMFARLAE